MDNQNEQLPENQLQTSSDALVEKEPFFKRPNLIFIIVASIFFVVFCIGIYVFNTNNTQESSIKISQITSNPQHPTIAKNIYETSQTKISNSLDVPQLYSQGEWEENTEIVDNDGLNEASIFLADNSYKRVSFYKGQYWNSKSPIEFLKVEEYYMNELENKGWVGLGENIPLQFNNFQLYGIIADGACGGQVIWVTKRGRFD